MQNGSRYVPPALRGAGSAGGPEGPPPEMSPGAGTVPGYEMRAESSGGFNDRPGGNYYNDNRSQTNSRWGADSGGSYSGGGYYGGSGGGGYSGGGYGNNRGGNYYDNRSGGYGGQGGSYESGGGGYRGGYDNRSYGGDRGGRDYNNRGGGGGFGGYDNNRGNSWGGGGGGGSSYGGRVNEMGFHGDVRPNPKVEQELFHTNDVQSAGINFDKYDDIPVEVSVGCPEPYNDFTVDTVGEQLIKNLTLMKFSKPTPVQKYSIPIGTTGGDMMACAQTGSGKTAGFLFPVLALMLRTGAAPTPDSRRKSTYPTALILAPTRELASQIYDEALKFAYCTGIRPVVVYGGANIQNQTRELDRGADILVATPGRLVDLIERGRIKLDIIRFLVLDEADRMLDMGFEPQIRRIVEQEGMPLQRQTFMFSATFPVEIQRLAADFMKDYIFVAVGRVGAASKDVTQRVEWVEQTNKVNFVIDFLKRAPKGLILIFVETKRGADYLEECLIRENFAACSIHGDKSQREREDALKAFKTARASILVATDVAARGLDIPNVVQVINFDLPSNIDDYVHRIGRTGRVGNIGNALSLMNEKNRGIGKELAELLIENQQDCPEWLDRMTASSGGSGGRGRGRGRGNRFGAKDFRRGDRNSGPAFVPPSNSWASAGSGGGGGQYGPPSSYTGPPPSARSGGGWTNAAPAASASSSRGSDTRGSAASAGGDKSAW